MPSSIVEDAFRIAQSIAKNNPLISPEKVEEFKLIEKHDLLAPAATSIEGNEIYYNPKIVKQLIYDIKREFRGLPEESVEFIIYVFAFLHEIYHHVFGMEEWLQEAKKIREDVPESILTFLMNIFHDALINDFVLGDLFQYFSQYTNPIVLASLILIFKRSAIEKRMFVFRESLEKVLKESLAQIKCTLPQEFFDSLDYYISRVGLDFIIGMKQAYLKVISELKCPSMPRIPKASWNDLKPSQKKKGRKGGSSSTGQQQKAGGASSSEEEERQGEGLEQGEYEGGSQGEQKQREGHRKHGAGSQVKEKERKEGGRGEEKHGKCGGRECEEEKGSEGKGKGREKEQRVKPRKQAGEGKYAPPVARSRGIGHAEFEKIMDKYMKPLGRVDAPEDIIVKGVSEAIALSDKSSSAFKKMAIESSIDLEDLISSFLKKESDYNATIYGPIDIAIAKYQIEKYGRVLTKTYELETKKSEPLFIWVIDTSGSISDPELEAMANIIAHVGEKVKNQYIVAFSDIAAYAKVEGKKSSDEILKIITQLAMRTGRGGTVIESAFDAIKRILSDIRSTRNKVLVVSILSDFEFGTFSRDALDISDYTKNFKKSIALLLNVGFEEQMKEFMYAIYYEFTDVEPFDVVILDNKIKLVEPLFKHQSF